MDRLLQTSIGALILPLLATLVVSLTGKRLSLVNAHRLTIGAIAGSCVLSWFLMQSILDPLTTPIDINLYTWAGDPVLSYAFYLGLLLDPLTGIMMLIVTSIALLVHIYSIGYMAGDPGYKRFFATIAFFTFAMLCLVTANNFLQLFIGWEAVGLASYLLIGFWNKREAANRGSLKAFLVNRVGDFGFLLGIALLFSYTGDLHYQTVFAKLPELQSQTIAIFGGTYSILTVIGLLLFIGAMGKSAQIPLHIWLPESMEGPTPVSALIHAATMVTAGIFMVIRLAPLYECTEVALSWMLIIGSTGALFLGLMALVVYDIKRVIAFSTLSQLGYMVAALGASAYSASLFHLCSHAFFKALLFLAAGSVIISLHHEQDMRKMGGLKSYLPLTYWTYVIGGLALCAVPPLSGFYSKDMVMAAIGHSTRFGAVYAYVCVCLAALVTPLYLFRSLFLTFHGPLRSAVPPCAIAWTMHLPLLILALPSIGFGAWFMQAMLFAQGGLLPQVGSGQWHMHAYLQQEFSDWLALWRHAPMTLTFWLTALGMAMAWLGYRRFPHWPLAMARAVPWMQRLLLEGYGLDRLGERIFVRGSQWLGRWFAQHIDNRWIDTWVVDGSGYALSTFAKWARKLHTGAVHHYISAMMLGMLGLILWLWFN